MSRVRSTILDTTVVGPCTWTGHRKNGTTYVAATTGPVTCVDTKTVTDVVTKNFYSLLSKGDFLPINPVTIRTFLVGYTSVHNGEMVHKNPGPLASTATIRFSGEAMTFSMVGLSVPPEYVPSLSDVDAVVIKAMAKAKEPDFDILTFIGELPETGRLLAKRWGDLANLAKKIARKARGIETRVARRKKRPYSGMQALKLFNDLWLEARYGWRPMLYDIESICKLLKEKSKEALQSKRATLVVDIGQEDEVFTDNVTSAFTTTFTRTGTCTHRAVVYYKGEMSAIGANPVLAGWELTRLSFVVDWFINVGAWIQAISPRFGYIELGVCTSTVVDYSDILHEVASEGAGHLWSVDMTPLTKVTNVKTYTRAPYSGIPFPSIQVNLNPAKIIDLIALAMNSQKDIAKILRL